MFFYILGWIAAAFMVGFALAWWIRQRKASLRQRVSRAAVFRGKTYAEVLRELGCEPVSAMQRTNGQMLRTWREDRYSITLLFDGADNCLGVESEASSAG